MDSGCGSVASSSVLASGYAAFKAGEKQIGESAVAIASASQLNSGAESATQTQQIPSADQVNQALLDLNQGSTYAKAGVRVIQAAFDMTGTLLNAFA